jgi:putative ATP-binding cassette transporter
MAFATLLGAFSLVITQFQAISSYASVIARLGEFVEHAEKATAVDLPR